MKLLTVPVSISAMHRLDTDTCLDGDLSEVEIESDDYKELWDSKILEKLNRELNILIDDFEDEVIPCDKLTQAFNIVVNYSQKKPHVQVLIKLKKQLEIAIENQTGIYFFF